MVLIYQYIRQLIEVCAKSNNVECCGFCSLKKTSSWLRNLICWLND